MKIENNNSVTFKSRCPEIRAGQDVCHLIKSEFPHYSLSQLNKRINTIHEKNYLVGKKYDHMVAWWENIKLQKIRERRDFILYSYYTIYDFAAKMVKSLKVADCGQLAELSSFILKLNGYNASIAHLKIKESNIDIDHAICVFNRSNKPFKKALKETIIVDPWLGECDFADIMLKKYKNKYNKHFKIHGMLGPEEDFLEFKPQDNISIKFLNSGTLMKESKIRNLRKIYPQLILKNSKYKVPERNIYNLLMNIKESTNLCILRRFFG